MGFAAASCPSLRSCFGDKFRVCPPHAVPRREGSFRHYTIPIRKPHSPKEELGVTSTDVSTCPVSEAQKWGVWGTHSQAPEREKLLSMLSRSMHACV